MEILEEGCLDCGRNLHELCGQHECCNPTPPPVAEVATVATGGKEKKSVGRPIKENPDDVKDKHSTGRKRAAMLYPLTPGADCEWKGKANCGGGKHPIIGCVNGVQQHRHHGPDKNTLNNAPGNVHRICDDCHNTWHSQNDKDYNPTLPHQPRLATKDELTDRILKIRFCADDKAS